MVSPVTNYAVGHTAERHAADYLVRQGYELLVLNWRTKRCEIDIIACRSDTVYFVEVKYRARDQQGNGFDYITSRKLQQMAFAAEIWMQQSAWKGEYQLAAIELSGPDFKITGFLTDL